MGADDQKADFSYEEMIDFSQYPDLTEEDKETIKSKIAEEALAANAVVNESVGEYLSNDNDLLEAVKVSASKMIDLIEIVAEMEFEDKVNGLVEKENILKKNGGELSAHEKVFLDRALKDYDHLLQFEVNKYLTQVVAENAGENMGSFRLEDQGFRGGSPLHVKNAIKNGNLREAMFVLYRTSWQPQGPFENLRKKMILANMYSIENLLTESMLG